MASKQEKVKVTKEGYKRLQDRLKELQQAQQDNIVAIQEARGQGDLSENADYSAAREQQAVIAYELKQAEANLRNAEIISDDESSNLGKMVKVEFLDDHEVVTYQILGTLEADPINFKISQECPLGKAILHSKIGDQVLVKTEDGERFEVKILDIAEKAKEEKATKSKAKTKK